MISGDIQRQDVPQAEVRIRQDTQDINPKAEAAGKDTTRCDALFQLPTANICWRERHESIDVPVNETLEAAVVRALIAGPSADRDELVPACFGMMLSLSVPKRTAIILLVTLSEIFRIQQTTGRMIPSRWMNRMLRSTRRAWPSCPLSIQSLKWVRIRVYRYYVNRESDIGERITRAEAGWTDDDGDYAS